MTEQTPEATPADVPQATVLPLVTEGWNPDPLLSGAFSEQRDEKANRRNR